MRFVRFARRTLMAKKNATEPQREFEGLNIRDVEEVELQIVNTSVWVFMKRFNGSIVRVWIRNPDRTTDVPPQVTVEVADS
jgi:hypothetical protein